MSKQMEIPELAQHITRNLPDDVGVGLLVATLGYMLSLIFADIEDVGMRERTVEGFAQTVRTTSNIPNESRAAN